MAKGEETRQFIIEKAAPIFNTKGIAATSMSDIMEATKLSKGSMYVHFENKEVLACAAVDHNIKMLNTKIQTAISKYKTSKEQLFAYIDFFSNPLQPPVFGGCPLLNFGTEADDTNPIVKEKVNTVIRSGQVLLSGLVEKGIANGEFKTDLKPGDFATVMFAMLEGGHLMSRMSGNNDKMEIIVKTLKNLIDQNSI
ncbi:TetR/AcrR family transcriptional regulator [Flavobacterium sp. WLB]|uniref:TetR/AcrR family transcriptional regulator n=1 Tax=Flavobacterium panici TaxID=2654843 RepID=A0A9N8J158_9FLAO|nr:MULTISPECIES: TetR/AcrR family transcriptional regulator [Flavobacterium]KOP37522.1 TetR family transcriptional regulator [Flavobacterium sp. VMW]OWU92368.1 TetR family transcriptional regulator [Flavobacterium sp. NLM]PUU70974.1 TetR/AcrR family transcriptional regulator [Flavobacterium sp. WLB]UUF13496.1 TetR/AcrR family transcriptional regulator [Flavobacterium panici]CAC9974320.1 TetR/AcrR family transcriptional regulator [Flavobacterium panici]